MLDLSPTKLVIIFVVVIVLLGPKRLPQVARQLGGAWRKLRTFASQMDDELRKTVPDLPSSHEIARFARSPVSILNRLADLPQRDGHLDGRGSTEGRAAPDPLAPPARRIAAVVDTSLRLDVDDPNLN